MDTRESRRGLGTLRVVLVALGLVAASVGGAFALGVVGAPSVQAVENRFGDVTDQTTVVETDLVVDNPNPVGVQLGGTTIDYTVAMNDVAMAEGTKEGLDVDPGNTTLDFSTRMQNTKIPDWWVTHLRNGEVTNVTVDADVRTSLLGDRTFDFQQGQQIETDIIGAFESDETRPVNASRPLVSDPILYINRTDAQYGTVTEAQTPIVTDFVVYNPKAQPYVVTEVGYEVTMNDIPVGEGRTNESYVVPGGTTETIRTVPTIRNERLDEWWVSHLQNDQVTDLQIDFYAKVELPTGDEIRIPLDALTYERTIETDIFGTKDETDASDAGAGDASTEGEGPAGTASPTPTPTDDGGLLDTATDATDTATDATDTPTDGVLGGTPTAAPTTDAATSTPAPTATPSDSPTATPTDDGGILGLD
ncbi:LEA type 2 family protein [Salinirubellus salinus]|uniref:LEA type 2 family protein n=1 Tax=Salinirubellus salinus TaxID=1364945 RepID=A0A9E7R5K5_9EURY|nr:LEA type 2 family protein [Salinirubellus salinus]UWM55133.1 LEA type 2 family protein [Salinirubellus salinus]